VYIDRVKELVVRPIGVVRSPFGEKVEAPRQARIAAEARGRIEIHPELESALDDLDSFDRIWVIFWFDQAEMKGTKVLPPRSERKRGVFATRSPHRPNPIGLSSVVLEKREGNVLFVRELDMIDGTPVLDLKPYIAYADAFPESKQGWLAATADDPRPRWAVIHSPLVEEQLAWIAERDPLDLTGRIDDALSLGPMPHPYRRIKKTDDGAYVLAVKEWRARFRIEGQAVIVDRIETGYRPKELPELHRAFVEKFSR
jgi:tRNA (adenine37-N6)-methyltransferase